LSPALGHVPDLYRLPRSLEGQGDAFAGGRSGFFSEHFLQIVLGVHQPHVYVTYFSEDTGALLHV
jgi:hypothetical protein